MKRGVGLVLGLLAAAFLTGMLLMAAMAAAVGTAFIGDTPSAEALSEIPESLLPVYEAAAGACPGLPWPVLAAIGWVESRHGGGNLDPGTGDVSPPILGPALDGSGGTARIPDPTSADGWTHARGPMQFLPSTFDDWGLLAPGRPAGAAPSADNAWDAIWTAAHYLCAGRDRLDDLHAAILRYNHSESYYQEVLAKSLAYGMGSSRGGSIPADAGERAVAAALTQRGVPYVWGGSTPGVGFDCSGLVQWAYAQVGVRLPRTTAEQIDVGIPVVDPAQLQPGDLIFSRSVRGGAIIDLGHVAMYIGSGQVVVAPHTGDVVRIRPLVWSQVQAARHLALGK